MSAQVGVKKLTIAAMTTEDTEDTQAVYGENQSVAETISINFQPQSAVSVLDADDGASEVDSSNGPVNVSINTKDLPLPIRALIMGSTYDATKGGLTHKSTDTPPYIAMSFMSKKANGKYRYVQLYKGKATQPKENYQTGGKQTNWNTPTTEFQFIRRIYDDVDYRLYDEPEFTEGAAFFDNVYEVPAV